MTGDEHTTVTGLVELVDAAILQDHLDRLKDVLGVWAMRDPLAPDRQSEVRVSASTAMDQVDLILQAAHRLRAELVGQILRYDGDRDTYWASLRKSQTA